LDNPDRSPVTELLSQARRRSITHLVMEQTALALTIGMGGVILLLLTGTQILDWYWVVLLTVVSLGVGICHVSIGAADRSPFESRGRAFYGLLFRLIRRACGG
jgi:hypothetical protein